MSLDVSTINAHLNHPATGHLARPQPVRGENQKPPATAKVDIQTLIQELSTVSAVFDRRLSFRINEKLGQLVVKVIDTETEKTIKEIPPAELQHVRERIREVIGILFDEQV